MTSSDHHRSARLHRPLRRRSGGPGATGRRRIEFHCRTVVGAAALAGIKFNTEARFQNHKLPQDELTDASVYLAARCGLCWL